MERVCGRGFDSHRVHQFTMDPDSWHIPLKQDTLTIRQGLATMDSFKLDQSEVPFIIRLFENPSFNILPGSVTLKQHDIIHLILGRGILLKDEAFVLGFTMGSTKSLNRIQKAIFLFVVKYIYPEGYRFGPEEIEIFESGLKFASESNCVDLTLVDLTAYIDYTIFKVREKVNIDICELSKMYITEKEKYNSPECLRLL